MWAYHRSTMIEPSTPSNNRLSGQPVRNPGNTPHIVLASGSPRRTEILASVGVDADVRPSNMPEHRLPGDATPEAWALRLAGDKAASASREYPDAVTIGADTIVVIEGDVLGKPASPDEAVATLTRLRNRPHRVVTAVALDGPTGRWSGWSSTDVKIRDLSDSEIAEYVDSRLPLDKAGSYGIQDRPFSPAELVKGCYLNVVGLPVCLLGELFELAGSPLDIECLDCTGAMNTVTAQA